MRRPDEYPISGPGNAGVLGGAYNWIGLGVGSIAVLLTGLALVSELGTRPIDGGSVAFALVFGLFWAGIAASCGYALLHARGQGVSGGCLFIVLVVGGLMLLSGALLLIPSVAGDQGPDPISIAIFFGLGAIFVLPTSLVLWHRRNPTHTRAILRLWQGIVAGVLIVFLSGVVFIAFYGPPYDVGFTAHAVISAIGVLGAALIAFCAAMLWRQRGSTSAIR